MNATIPRVAGGPLRAIKGEGPEPGSKFDYAAKLTEITNHPELSAFVKEPAREGWSYGEELWTHSP